MEYERPAYRPHSALMLRAQITLPHFSVSSAISLIKSADEPASAVPPSSASRVLILGSGRAAARSTFGRRRMARGRLAMRQSGPETMLPRWLGDCYEKKSAAAASGIVCIRTGRAGVSPSRRRGYLHRGFEQCCEKGTRERKLGGAAFNWWGETTIETVHEVRLKQSCIRFDGWVEQASQPREELRRAAGPHHASGSLLSPNPQRLAAAPIRTCWAATVNVWGMSCPIST